MLLRLELIEPGAATCVLWRNTPVCWVCNLRVSRDMQVFMMWLIPGVLASWWGYAWKGHFDNWALKDLSTGIEASATGGSLNSGDPAVRPAARHRPHFTFFLIVFLPWIRALYEYSTFHQSLLISRRIFGIIYWHTYHMITGTSAEKSADRK